MATKRRFQTIVDESEPVAKKSMQQDYLSALPTELLLEIFSFLDVEDQCIKALTETCTRFEKILKNLPSSVICPRLALCLDFDRINREGFPTILGSYSNISIIGSEIESKHKSILDMLENSKSVKNKTLTIGEAGKVTKIKLQTLLLLLGMTNLVCLNVFGLDVSTSRIKIDSIPDQSFPELSQLNHVYLRGNTGLILSAFKKKTDLASLLIGHPEDIETMRSFIAAQTKLQVLVSDPLIKLEAGALPQLRTFYVDDSTRAFDDEVFDFAPNLQELVLLRQCSTCNASLLYFNESSTIKSIRFMQAEMPLGFDVNDILPSYPSLQSIDCPNYQWRKN